MVFARIAADADHPSLAKSMVAIANNRAMYGLSGAARLLSGITLMAAAWYLLRTWIIRERLATQIVPALFVVSGIVTAVSGALALALAATVDVDLTDPHIGIPLAQSTETITDLRWLTGKIGFTLMGFALLVATPYQWKAGGLLRYISVVTAAMPASPCSSSGSTQFATLPHGVHAQDQRNRHLRLAWYLSNLIGIMLLSGALALAPVE